MIELLAALAVLGLGVAVGSALQSLRHETAAQRAELAQLASAQRELVETGTKQAELNQRLTSAVDAHNTDLGNIAMRVGLQRK